MRRHGILRPKIDIGKGMWDVQILVIALPGFFLPCQKRLPELKFSQHLEHEFCAKAYIIPKNENRILTFHKASKLYTRVSAARLT